MSSVSSKSDDLHRDLPETLLVASVRRPHGVRGDLLVEIHSEVQDRLAAGARLILVRADGRRTPVDVLASRPHQLGALLSLRGVDSREAADELRGAELEIARDEVPMPPVGSYHYHELIGCRCRDRSEGALGEVVDLVEDGGGLLLRVVGTDGRELLLPFVERYLVRLDPAAGEIEFELPGGLVETCASTR